MRYKAMAPPAAAAAMLCLLSVASLTPPAQGRNQAPPADATITTEELVETRGLSGLSISPDARYAAVRVDQDLIAGNRTRLTWRIVEIATGRTWEVGDAGEPLLDVNGGLEPDMPQWSADGRWIYFRRLKDQQVQVARARVSDGRVEQVTRDPADVQGFLLAGDSSIAFAVSGATRAEILDAEARDHDRGVLMDRSVIPGFPLTNGFPVSGRMATLKFGKGQWRQTLLGDRPLVVKGLAPHGRDKAPVRPEVSRRILDWWSSSAVGRMPIDTSDDEQIASPGGKNLARVGRRLRPPGTVGPPRPLLVVGQGDQADITCDAPVCDASHIELVGWLDEDELVFQASSSGTTRLALWNIATLEVRVIAQTEAAWGRHFSGTAGGCKLAAGSAICLSSAAADPPTMIAVDLRTGKERVLYDANPSFRGRLGSAEKLVVANHWGGRTYSWLILPSQPANAEPLHNLPLVVTSYSCRGFLQGGSGRDVPEHVLAGLGYAAFCLDLGADSVEIRPGFDPLQDSNRSALDFVLDAVRILSERGLIDPRRVVLSGFSGSSTATLDALIRTQALTAAIVTTQGSADPIDYYTSPLRSGQRAMFLRQGYKPPFDTGDNPFYRETSPAWNADRIVTPLLIQVAEVEHVPLMQLFAAMKDLDRAVEMFVFPGEYHIKRMPRHRLSVYRRSIDWINFWLRGIEATGPEGEQQSLRWREMRAKQCTLFDADPSGARPWYCKAATSPSSG